MMMIRMMKMMMMIKHSCLRSFMVVFNKLSFKAIFINLNPSNAEATSGQNIGMQRCLKIQRVLLKDNYTFRLLYAENIL